MCSARLVFPRLRGFVSAQHTEVAVVFMLNEMLDDPFSDNLDVYVAQGLEYAARGITPYRVEDRQEPTGASLAPQRLPKASIGIDNFLLPQQSRSF
jgi:hypothetical protein